MNNRINQKHEKQTPPYIQTNYDLTASHTSRVYVFRDFLVECERSISFCSGV